MSENPVDFFGVSIGEGWRGWARVGEGSARPATRGEAANPRGDTAARVKAAPRGWVTNLTIYKGIPGEACHLISLFAPPSAHPSLHLGNEEMMGMGGLHPTLAAGNQHRDLSASAHSSAP